MGKNTTFSISASITDFPLLAQSESLIKGLKETGVDSIEVVIGWRSRLRLEALQSLAEKYEIPIASIHQPPWSGLEMYFDERLFQQAANLGIQKVVFHPLMGKPFSHPKIIAYFERLARVQEKYGIIVMLENLADSHSIEALNYPFPLHKDAGDMMLLYDTVQKYGLHMTLDTSHVGIPSPHKEKWFDTIFPKIANIHLSSFIKTKDHLPLDMGDFDTKGFVTELNKREYAGLVTLEIFYPSILRLRDYDYGSIKKSVDTIRSI
jgi:sugar phosphate isomerase/epimerase